jgi:rSAM/selenodomain-associated transferase 1
MITNVSPAIWLLNNYQPSLSRRFGQVGGLLVMKSFPRKSAHEVFTEKRETDRSADGKCAIGIFIKAPKAGSSKTRLSPPFTPAECAALSRCFLKDTAENISNVAREKKDVIGIGVYAPVGSKRNFQMLLPADFLLIPQRGEDLGERLRNAAEDLFSAGFGSVCFIGADSPTLPPSYLARMVDYLGRSRNGMAIGPSADGGYYAIGLKKAIPRLFEDIDWITDRVFEQTKARASTNWAFRDCSCQPGTTWMMNLRCVGFLTTFIQREVCKEPVLRIPPFTQSAFLAGNSRDLTRIFDEECGLTPATSGSPTTLATE